MTADETTGSNLEIDLRKEERQSSTATDVDSGEISDVVLEHCERKQEPVASSDLIRLCRPCRQQSGQILLVLEDEAYECIS